ncbi:MAG TPA: hypothetical protein VFI37_03600 [Gaiellaceae bacterium]|nr:hypothetical protein [Gaiellaceae bacterium]
MKTELLDELRILCARLPVPQPEWHPHVPEIRAFRADFERALALAAERPAALTLAAELLDAETEPELAEGAAPELAAAWRRLEELPPPGGQHPFLDEIAPALEAVRILLAALSRG